MAFHGGQKVTFGPWASGLSLVASEPWQGGEAMFCGTGVMAGGSTATLQMSLDGRATWFTVYDINGNAAVLAAAEPRNFQVKLPPTADLQVVLSGAPTNFTGYMIGI